MAVCHGRGELRPGGSTDVTRSSVRGVTCLGTHLCHHWSGVGRSVLLQGPYRALKVLKSLEFDWIKFKAFKTFNFTK